MSTLEFNDFARQFDASLRLAQSNEQTPGMNNAWFRVRRVLGERVGKYTTELVRLAEVVQSEGEGTYTLGPGVAEPDWVVRPGDSTLLLGYDRTRFTPDVTTTWSETAKSHSVYHDRKGLWKAPHSSFPPAVVSRVCLRWARLADSYEGLGLAMRSYVDWMTSDRTEISMGDNTRLGGVPMRRSFILAGEPDLDYTNAGPYVDALGRLDPSNPNHAKIREVAGLIFSAVLLDGEVADDGVSVVVEQPTKMTALEMLDDRGVLGPEWWIYTGIGGGGAIAFPSLMPLVYKKMTSEEVLAMMESIPPRTAHSLTAGYLTELLNAYTRDETRDSVMMQNVRRHVIRQGVADPVRFIAIAKAIMRGEDLAPELHRPKLDPHKWHSLGDAILIVLERSRLTTATDKDWGAQFDQDVLHAEIVDTLHYLTRQFQVIEEDMATASLRLRYPFAHEGELDTIRGQLASGMAPIKIRAGFRSGQTPPVSSWRARRPGRELRS